MKNSEIKKAVEAVKMERLVWSPEEMEHKFVQDVDLCTFDSEHGIVSVSAENGDGVADYYGEFRGGFPWIDPALEAVAVKYGCIWEWDHPGSITLYRD